MARIPRGWDTEFMTRVDRVVLSVLAVGLVLAVLNGLRSAEARPVSPPHAPDKASPNKATSAPPQAPPRADVGAFLKGLDRLRHNDETVLPALREQSQSLCSEHGRCDFRDMLAYFAALSPAERTAGLGRETRFLALRSEIVAAREKRLSPELWRALRDRVLEDLRQLAASAGDEGDCVPSARALSLCALLEVEWIEKDSTLSSQRREDLLSSAESNAKRSMALFQSAGALAPQVEPTWLLGRLEAARGLGDSARATFDACLELARRLGNAEFEENSLLGMISLAREDGDLYEVERLVDEIATFRTPEQSWPLARAQAELLFERDQADLAAEFLGRHRPADAAALPEWHYWLALALVRAGRPDEAALHYEAGAGAPAAFDQSWAMAALQLRSGDPSEVVAKFDDDTVLAELQPTFRMTAEALLGEAFFRLQKFDPAVDHLQRALELASAAQTRLESQRARGNAAISVLGEYMGMHALTLLADANAHLDKDLEAARVIEAYQVHALRHVLTAQGRLGSNDESAAPVRDADLLEWARSFEFGLVTWVVGADSSVVAHVAPDGSALALPIARGRTAIDEAVRRLREAAVVGDEASVLHLVREIRSELLPDRIIARLAGGNRTVHGRLLFLLHGPLERLPIELFALDGDPFDGRCIPVVLPGLPEPSPGVRPARRDPERWVLLGSPVDTAGVALLPGTLEELASLARMRADSASFVGAAFDSAALREALKGSAPIHIATHLRPGSCANKGRLADVGFELSRGESFSALEILEARPKLPLAVLDACETAGGKFVDGEGLQGIARAFLESGTRNLIVTLWPVDDRVARAFAVALHEALMRGELPSEATASARRALRAAGNRPADWAAFRALARD
jgi:tetratricopeptide (TPR) repeat protein